MHSFTLAHGVGPRFSIVLLCCRQSPPLQCDPDGTPVQLTCRRALSFCTGSQTGGASLEKSGSSCLAVGTEGSPSSCTSSICCSRALLPCRGIVTGQQPGLDGQLMHYSATECTGRQPLCMDTFQQMLQQHSAAHMYYHAPQALPEKEQQCMQAACCHAHRYHCMAVAVKTCKTGLTKARCHSTPASGLVHTQKGRGRLPIQAK